MRRKTCPMSIFEVHNGLFDALCEVVNILDKHGIRYYLMFGTLLGCIRDGGPIKWDDDIDICVRAEDWERMNNILIDEIDSGRYFILNHLTKPDYPDCRYITRVGLNGTFRRMEYYKDVSNQSGIFIDIFQLCSVPDGRLCSMLWECELDVIDGIINLKTMNKGTYPNPHLISKIIYFMYGNKRRVAYWNQIRRRIQNKYNDKATKYITVPFGRYGVYSLQKARYKKSWFEVALEKDFSVKNSYGVTNKEKKFSVPSGYANILSVTYGNWKKKPKLRVAPATSFWEVKN